MSEQRVPILSVVVPLYNKESAIVRTLTAVNSQTVSPAEIIVVDDQSDDKSVEVAKKCINGDTRFRIVRQSHGGVSVARNRGVTECRGTHVLFLDADDVWEPTHVEHIRDLVFRYPDCGLYVSGHRAQGKVGKSDVSQRTGILKPPEFYQLYAGRRSLVHTSAVAVDRDKFINMGGFLKGGMSGQDILLWLKMGAQYPTAYCSTVTSTKMLDHCGHHRRASYVPCYISYFSTRLAEMPTELRPSLRRIMREGAVKSYVASVRSGCDLSRELCKTLWRVSPAVASIFAILSLPVIRSLSAGSLRVFQNSRARGLPKEKGC